MSTFDTSVHSPVDGSAAVMAPGAEVGTLGCLVELNGKRYVLGSGHVMVAASGPAGSGRLYHPPIDLTGHTAIANPFDKAIAVKDGKTSNRLDAALDEVIDPKAVTAKIGDLGFPSGFRTDALAVGEVVRIHGAGSQKITSGAVAESGFSYFIDYGPYGLASFAGLVRCAPYGKAGDSGAAVLDANNKVVGIHLASTTTMSLFCPIAAAIARWPGMTLVTHD